MEIEHQHFMELWFLLSSFDFVDVETVPVLGVKIQL